MMGECRASSETEWFKTCIPNSIRDYWLEIDPKIRDRYRAWMLKWYEGNKDYISTQNILFGCSKYTEYNTMDTGISTKGFANAFSDERRFIFHGGTWQNPTFSYGLYNEVILKNYEYLRKNMCSSLLITQDQLDLIWHLFYFPYNSARGKAMIDEAIATQDIPIFAQQWLTKPRTQGDDNDIYIQTHFQLLNQPPMTEFYFDQKNDSNLGQTKTQLQTDWSQHVWGDPTWNNSERQFALRKILPNWDGENFLDGWNRLMISVGVAPNDASYEDNFSPAFYPGKTNPTTIAAYMGNLPFAPPFLNENQEPWHPLVTDPDAEGFKDPCINQTFLEKWIPIGAGGFAAVVGASVVPGQWASTSAAISLGGAGYYMIKSTYGYDAWARENLGGVYETFNDLSPEFIGIGAPVTAVLMASETGLIAMSSSEVTGALVVGAGVGYLVLVPKIRTVLNTSSTVFSILLTPISMIDKGLTQLFNGCVTNRLSTIGKCRCEDAMQKQPMIESFLTQIYGTTGQQQSMRRTCLRAAMTRGTWGPDSNRIGDCRSDGTKTNPAACIVPGIWAYQRFGNDPLATTMWGEISHCLDEANPSFLPPQENDKQCEKYGSGFRLVDGKCQNMRAPLGLRDPGEYKDPLDTSINATCTIL